MTIPASARIAATGDRRGQQAAAEQRGEPQHLRAVAPAGRSEPARRAGR